MSGLIGALYAFMTGIAALGLGTALARCVGAKVPLGERGLLGLFSFAVLASVAHFFIPLGSAFQLCVLSAGILLFLLRFRADLRQTQPGVAIAIVLTLFYFGLTGPWVGREYDQGLYYFQILRWNREFPIVLGLANLHGRLAFNAGYFLMASVVPPLLAWVPNALLGAFLAGAAFERCLLIGKRTPVNQFHLSFLILMGASFAMPLSFGQFRPDTFVRGLIVYWTSLAIEQFADDDIERLRANARMMMIVATFATVTKLSALPLLPLSVVALMIRKRVGWRAMLSAGAVCVGVLLSWVLQSVLISGCLIYPVPATCIASLPWASPLEQVTWHAVSVKAWARLPDSFRYLDNATSWQWVRPWLRSNLVRLPVLTLIASVLIGLAIMIRERTRQRNEFLKPALRVGGLLCLGLAYWFLTAPDFRFATGYIVSLILLWVAVPASIWMNLRWWRTSQFTIALWVAIGILLHLPNALQPIPGIPAASVYQLKGPDGSAVFVAYDERSSCWDHPLPCAASPHPSWWGRIRWTFRTSRETDSRLTPPPGWKYLEQEDARSLNAPERLYREYRPEY